MSIGRVWTPPRRVTLHDLDAAVGIEVDGALDAVAGQDLREAVDAALRESAGTVVLDLSRVTAADEDGVAALAWCSDRAVAARRVLRWAACSRPLRRDVRASAAAVRRRPGGARRPPELRSRR